MFGTKLINKSCKSKLLYQSTWLVENTVHYDELTITPNAKIVAPEGKFVTLTVNGIGHDVAPGTYYGDVVLSVSDVTPLSPHSLMRQNEISCQLSSVLTVDEKSAELRVPAMAQGGSVNDDRAEGVYFGTTAQSYNGVVVQGDAKYQIKDCTFDFEGFSCNDFIGVGSGVLAIDKAQVSIDDCNFNFSGVTRCAIHVGGESNVVTSRCDITNISPNSDWVGDFSWQVALLGTNRLCQLADGAKATYNDCSLTTNGWGICSIDGTNSPVELTINRCKMRLVGPRAHGYGAFCIGDNTVTIKDSDVLVNGYPMLVMGMKGMGRPSILGSTIRGRRFGAMVYSDSSSIFNIKDSTFNTGKSTLCVKGSITTINIENTQMTAGNNTILQLMDTDECGMNSQNFVVPVGEIDTYVEGRDLTSATSENDVILNISNCCLNGNFFNSTTNLLADKRSTEGGKGLFHDTMAGLPGMDDGAVATPMGGPGGPMPGGMPGGPGGPEGMPGGFSGPEGMPGGTEGGPGPMPGGMPMMKATNGPKNLGLNLTGTTIEGIISSALQSYREGLTEITAANRTELSNITQKAAPTVNNGVVLNLDASSRWIVTETSYITAITLEAGASVCAPEGRTLTVTVDGVETALTAGSYAGRIVLEVR